MSSDFVRFSKLRSTTDCTFWAKFAELKIDKFKLDDKSVINLWGSHTLQSTNEGTTNPLVLDCTSFNESVETTSHNSAVACHGYMVNRNTFEAFRQTDPEKFIDTMGKQIIDNIKDGSALKEPWRLAIFLVLSYSDLKRYRFHYWVAHPTPFSLPEMYYEGTPEPISKKLTPTRFEKFSTNFLQLDCRLKNYLTVILSGRDDIRVVALSEGVDLINKNSMDKEKSEIYFAFYDPCASSEPGWPLRNLLCLLYWNCPDYCFTKNIQILSVRGQRAQNSVVFTLKTKQRSEFESLKGAIFSGRLVGWESNANGKMGPNIADLSNAMNPAKLSDRAINLNLKLMKWRLVPNLDLEKISKLRCLLLGAGTLGCSVARVLLGWGVNSITFVDSSNVSHSNTVRQSLYTHEDAVERRFKAHAARDALRNIRPSINAEGVVLHIPMPGHVVGQSMMKTTEDALTKLEDLIRENDVIFLLLDSREARWLPTLLCAAMNKIAINAALGFDSYTVQRHGTRNFASPASPDLTMQNPYGADLGCYFCNDVTQPGNSQTDRTLDQQCTVSRPGLSQIAAGLAVELLVALLQHPQGIDSAALMDENRDAVSSNESKLIGLLGGIPHTIRGSLSNYEMRLTITHRFPACTACSVPLVSEYKQRGFGFVLDACNVPNYLERLSGLEEILKRPGLDDLCYALDTSSDDNDDERPNVAT